MAIRRCPYCKAIIEEGAEYCSNCGTQLLFPEDEKIDEEIPGEKVVDDDSDDDDEEEEIEPLEEDKDVDPVAEDFLVNTEEDELPLFHEEEVEEEEPAKKKNEKSVDLADAEIDPEPEEVIEEEIDISGEIHLEEQEIQSEELNEDPDVEGDMENEPDLESEGAVLKLEDLGKVEKSEELEKQEIDRFIDSIKQDQGLDIPSAPPPKELSEEFVPKDEEPDKDVLPEFIPPPSDTQEFIEPIQKEPFKEYSVPEESDEAPLNEEEQVEVEEVGANPDKEIVVEDSSPIPPTSPSFEKRVIVPPTDDLPAWASKIVEQTPSSIPMTKAEKEFQPEEKTPSVDTGMGLPEAVAQKDLPFSEESVEAKEIKPKAPPMHMSTWMKARIFDVVFIGVVWFITTWIASYVMEVKLFKLIFSAALLLLGFYAVLLVAYLFLFFFFLGGTLGDYLFNPNQRPGSDRLI